MRSPLNKRLFRELRVEFGKYLVIFILMTLTIGMVSGFLGADGSRRTRKALKNITLKMDISGQKRK